MQLKVINVGAKKISYKDHKTVEFDNLGQYLTMARKAIAKMANKIFDGLSKKMLKDEEAISSVAYAIMMGDWRWDESYQNEKGTKKNKYSYRNQCALWAIKTYATNMYKNKFQNVYSLDFVLGDDESDSHEMIEDMSVVQPYDYIIEQEKEQHNKQLIQDILSSAQLSDRQKDHVRLYYMEDMTFDEIGKKYGVTREAVRQSVKKAMEKIEEVKNGFSCAY